MDRSNRLRALADKLHTPTRKHIGKVDFKLMHDAAREIDYLNARLQELHEAHRLINEFTEEGAR